MTDRGWFLSTYGTEEKNCDKTHVSGSEGDGEENERTSLDSGVDMESNSTKNSKDNPPMRQEDSGCGSLGGPESSATSRTDFALQEESSDSDIARKTETSMSDLELHSCTMNQIGQNSGSLKEGVTASGGNYCSQSPASVHIQVCDDEDVFNRILPESVLAKVAVGYRAGPQWCICSGAGQCSWCHRQGLNGSGVKKQYRLVSVERELQKNKCSFSCYSKQTQMETPFILPEDTFPQLAAVTQLPLAEGKQVFNMNNISLSLCDVQLTND